MSLGGSPSPRGFGHRHRFRDVTTVSWREFFAVVRFFVYQDSTLPETNNSPLKMDGWNTIVSFWGPAYFQGRTVSFRECKLVKCYKVSPESIVIFMDL